MTLEEEYRLSFYQQIAEIDHEHNVVLVQHTGNQKIFVKKTLKVYEESVFLYLKEHYIPGIPRIIEAVRNQEELVVIEEYVSGQSLSDILAEKGTLSEKETRQIMLGLIEILKRLHSQDPPIIHRDIKPSNVILKEDGGVMLLDMNAAKWYRRDAYEDTRLIGTFRYAAPEQYGFGQSGIETDIYSLGVLANVMLTGTYPQEKPAEGEMGEIIALCTKMEPSQRFRSDDALYEAFEKLKVPIASDENRQVREVKKETPEQNKKSRSKYLFPGLNSEKKSVRGWSLAGYIILVLISCVQRVENASPPIVWLNRLFCFLFFLLPILFSCNYLHVLDKLRITKIKNRFLRILVIAAADFVILLLVVILVDLLELLIKKA